MGALRTPSQRAGRATHLFLAVVVAAAVIGFFVGIDYGVPKPDEAGALPIAVSEVDASGYVIPALSYSEVRRTKIGANRNWRSDLSRLPRVPHMETAPASAPAPEERWTSLNERAVRRAYHGAPPVIPHAVDTLSDSNCLSCHSASVRIGSATSAILPHPYLASCQQCHVAAGGVPFEPNLLAASTFSGRQSPVHGERAWPGAPPVVPHPTFMRDNCLACHGAAADAGLRTTHPWRQSCLQCHAPSSELEQPGVASRPAFLPALIVEGE